jgi:Protein of unknown function (DUF3775)
MLRELNPDQVHFVALLARTAREQRDALLGHVAETELSGTIPGRGEHNPTAELGFEPLPAADLQAAALREAIASLSEPACQELYALMRIGQGHLAPKKWHRGLVEAKALGRDAVTAALTDDADLHDHLSKGLYEIKLSL